MKKLYTFLLLIASIAVLFSSCVKEEKHQAGEADVEGCYGVYFPAQDGSIALDPADPTVATIKVARNNTTGAITVPVEFTEPDGIVTAGDITFDDGQGETTCKLTFDNAEVGVVYTCKFVISDPQYASKYSKQPIAFDYKISRDKWNSLGKAKFTDSFVFENTYEAELIQNDKNKNVFRLLDPYTEGLKAEEYYPDNVKAGPTPYIEFRILKQGESIYKDGSAKVTQKDLVYFINYRTGFYHTTYNNEVNAFFPGTFTKYSDETGWMYNRVLQYQDTGLPAGVQLAPYYYIEGVGGWDESQKNGTITIVFPGAVLTDFSLKLEAGQSDEGELPVDFTLGTDRKSTRLNSSHL